MQLDKFKRQLDDSISLIEQRIGELSSKRSKRGINNLQEFDSIAQSLLDRCESISNEAKQKPKVYIFNIFGIGITDKVLNLLYSLPNTTTLRISELYRSFLGSDFDASNLSQHVNQSVIDHIRSIIISFQQTGAKLILVDEIHTSACLNKLILKKIEREFEINSILLVSETLSTFAYLVARGVFSTCNEDFMSFISSLRQHCAHVKSEQIFGIKYSSDLKTSTFKKMLHSLGLHQSLDLDYLDLMHSTKLKSKNRKESAIRLTGKFSTLNPRSFNEKEATKITRVFKYVGFKDFALSDLNHVYSRPQSEPLVDIPKLLKEKEKIVIVVAGMRHSGSTALFNILRIAFSESNYKCLTAYSENIELADTLNRNPQILLLKTHEFRDDVSIHADIVLTTTRDLRDTVASAVRRGFPMLKRLGNPKEYAKYNRMLHDAWNSRAEIQFIYEEFMSNPLNVVEELLTRMNMESGLNQKVVDSVHNLPTTIYEETLFSNLHITDPNRNKSYVNTLGAELIEQITAEHRAWLEANNYE